MLLENTSKTETEKSKSKSKTKKDEFIPSPSPKKRKYKRKSKSKFDDIEDDENNERKKNVRELAKDHYIDNDGKKIEYIAPTGMFFIPF